MASSSHDHDDDDDDDDDDVLATGVPSSSSSSSEEEINILKIIPVHFGGVETAAVLATSCGRSIMTRNFYEKIRRDKRRSWSPPPSPTKKKKEKAIPRQEGFVVDGCGGKSRILQSVTLDVGVENASITLPILVVSSLVVELILGTDFMCKVKGSFDCGGDGRSGGWFKWFYGDELKVTSFMGGDADTKRVCTCGRYDGDAGGAGRAAATERVLLISPSSEESSLRSTPPPLSSPLAAKATSSTDDEDRRTVLVYTHYIGYLSVRESATTLGYCGIWWSKKHPDNVFHVETISKMSMIGFNLKAICLALEKAISAQIKRLRVVTNRLEGVDLAKNFLKGRRVRTSKQAKCALSDYVVYKKLCALLESMDDVAVEFVVDAEEGQMRKAEKAVFKFIADQGLAGGSRC